MRTGLPNLLCTLVGIHGREDTRELFNAIVTLTIFPSHCPISNPHYPRLCHHHTTEGSFVRKFLLTHADADGVTQPSVYTSWEPRTGGYSRAL
jgi:hypothetical protein